MVPSELEYAEGYRARMNVLWSKMRPLPNTKEQQSHSQQKQQTSKPKPTSIIQKPLEHQTHVIKTEQKSENSTKITKNRECPRKGIKKASKTSSNKTRWHKNRRKKILA